MPDAQPDGAYGASAAAACQHCGGELVAGGVAIPFLGSPRFSYKVKTVDVTVPLDASLCLGCGHVTLRAPDTEPIRQAATALDRASEWTARSRRGSGGTGTSKGKVGR